MANLVDKSLRFMQKSFNTGGSYKQVMRDLNRLAKILERDRNRSQESMKLQELNRRKAKDTEILGDRVLDERVRELVEGFDFTDGSLQRVYGMADYITQDIWTARGWLLEYKKAIANLEMFSMERLEQLGKAILGRAIELCPRDTGFLRESGTLLVYEDHIVITFKAPYAIYVHENMNNYHPIGQAKFLEVAAQEFLDDVVWVDILESDILSMKIGLGNEVEFTHYE